MACKKLYKGGLVALTMTLQQARYSSATSAQYALDNSDNLDFPIEVWTVGSRSGDETLTVLDNGQYVLTGSFTGVTITHIEPSSYGTPVYAGAVCVYYVDVLHYTGETFIQSDQTRYWIDRYRSETFELIDGYDPGSGPVDNDGDGVFTPTDPDDTDPNVPNPGGGGDVPVDNDGDGVFTPTDPDDTDPNVPVPGGGGSGDETTGSQTIPIWSRECGGTPAWTKVD